jgi:hypothetical protein
MALTKPFAENGDKLEIPQTASDGSVSYDQGFGAFYALPPEEGGKFIDRAQFNQLMYDTTSAVIDNQNSINTLNTKVANIESGVATGVVNLTTNQTIGGIKTFSSPVVVPNGTANTHAVNLAQLNTKANANATVNLTGNQTVAGNKTLSGTTTLAATVINGATQLKGAVTATGAITSSGNVTFNTGQVTFNNKAPISSVAPTEANHLATKAYVDSKAGKTHITQTYSNGTSWYRIWSDKWCEQGGSGSTGTITFLKPFKDTNYTVTTRMLSGSGDVAWHEYGENTNKTTITFTVGTRPVSWHACGYIA